MLPVSADLPATTTTSETVQTILGVKALLAQLVLRAQDPAGVLEALAALLEAPAAQPAERAVQRLHYVHLAVKALQGVRARGCKHPRASAARCGVHPMHRQSGPLL